MAPRSSLPKPTTTPAPNTLIVDNGAYTIKAGFVPSSEPKAEDCHIIPNCIARGRDKRVWIGSELSRCRDFGEMAFRRPVERGYLVNWEGQSEIWEHEFFEGKAPLECDPHETNLILTEAPNAPAALQSNSDQMIFEEFRFASYYRCVGPSLNSWHPPPLFSSSFKQLPYEVLLVVDLGYSHTTITPLLCGFPIASSVRRLPVGGKLMTNHLKKLISLRHYGLMDEPHLVSEIKEDTCFVSLDFNADLERTWKGSNKRDGSLVLDYVLPTYDKPETMRGHTRPYDPSVHGPPVKTQQHAEDSFPLGNERFSVPELLFNPTDIGIPSAGLPEAILQVLNSLQNEPLRAAMTENILLVGASALLPGLKERLERDLRALLPAEHELRLLGAADPVKNAWMGGASLARDQGALRNVLVTKQEYDEHGSNWLLKRFAPGGNPNIVIPAV